MTGHSTIKILESRLILNLTSHLSNHRKRKTDHAGISMLTEVGSSRKIMPTKDAEEAVLESRPGIYVLTAAQSFHEPIADKAEAKGGDNLTYALAEESLRKFSANEGQILLRELLKGASKA